MAIEKVDEGRMLELSGVVDRATYVVKESDVGSDDQIYRLQGNSSQSCQSQNSSCSVKARTYDLRRFWI